MIFPHACYYLNDKNTWQVGIIYSWSVSSILVNMSIWSTGIVEDAETGNINEIPVHRIRFKTPPTRQQ